jgi:uncharacterized membrane protein (DUF485 family)
MSGLEDILATIVSVLSVALPILMVIFVFLMVWLISAIFSRRKKKREESI